MTISVRFEVTRSGNRETLLQEGSVMRRKCINELRTDPCPFDQPSVNRPCAWSIGRHLGADCCTQDANPFSLRGEALRRFISAVRKAALTLDKRNLSILGINALPAVAASIHRPGARSDHRYGYAQCSQQDAHPRIGRACKDVS